MPFLVFFVGLLLWLPVVFLSIVTKGIYLGTLLHYLAGGLNIAAAGPVLALAIPGFIHSSRGGSQWAVAWAIALAPLLVVIGSMSTYFFQNVIFGVVYHGSLADQLSPFIAFALWAIPGYLLHRSYSVRSEPTLDEKLG